jgi:hypothetical protein
VAFAFALPRASAVRLDVVDVGGRLVATLVNRAEPAGWHRVPWDSRDILGGRVPAGIYLARLAAGGRIVTRKLVVLP